jgi:hypothetical protein
MTLLQVLDDAGRFDDRIAIVEQHRKLPEGPMSLELGEILRMLFVDHSVFELGSVCPERDQDLLAIG